MLPLLRHRSEDHKEGSRTADEGGDGVHTRYRVDKIDSERIDSERKESQRMRKRVRSSFAEKGRHFSER